MSGVQAMRKILVGACAVTITALVVGSSGARIPGDTPYDPVFLTNQPSFAGVGPPQRNEASVSRKLVLPNVRTLTTRLLRSSRETAVRQLASSRQVVAFFQNPSRTWLRALRHEKCWEVPWQRSCTVARHAYRLHLTLAVAAQRKLDHELPFTNDWQTAVRIAQRVYPGTESWLLSISDREGGWGRWVWWSGSCSNPPCHWQGYHVGYDSTGDTVGGPLQFRYSTFAPYWRAAQADLKRRGYIIPDIPMPSEGGDPKYAGWLSMLGQALTGGYMRYYGKDSCHWCL